MLANSRKNGRDWTRAYFKFREVLILLGTLQPLLQSDLRLGVAQVNTSHFGRVGAENRTFAYAWLIIVLKHNDFLLPNRKIKISETGRESGICGKAL